MFIVGSFSVGMELPTLQLYYTIDSHEGQCCRRSAPPAGVFAGHLIQTTLNLFFPFLLFLRGKPRGMMFQHDHLSLKRYGSGFLLTGNRFCHWASFSSWSVTSGHFPPVLWGNAKRRHTVKSAALSSFSTLRSNLARGQDCQFL